MGRLLRKRFFPAIVVLLLVAVLVSICTVIASARLEILRVAALGNAEQLHPLMATSTATAASLVYEPLCLYVNDTFHPWLLRQEPQVIREHAAEPGGVVRLELKQDLFWHDGHKITSSDVVFAFEKLYQTSLPDLPSLEGRLAWIEAVSETVVELDWRGDWPDLYSSLLLRPLVPAHLWQPLVHEAAKRKNPATFILEHLPEPVGSGPYQVVRSREMTLSMRPNRRYHAWDRRIVIGAGKSVVMGPFWDGIIWQRYSDLGEAIRDVKGGYQDLVLAGLTEEGDFTISATGLRHHLDELLQSNTEVRALRGDTLYFMAFGKQLQQQKTQAAVALRNHLAALSAQAATHLVKDWLSIQGATSGENTLLAWTETALEDADAGGQTVSDGSVLANHAAPVTLICDLQSPGTKVLVPYLKRVLEESKVPVLVQEADRQALLERVFRSKDYSAALLGWRLQYGHPDYLITFFGSNPELPYSGSLSGVLHQDAYNLLQQAIRSKDSESWPTIWRRAVQILGRDAAWQPLFYAPQLIIARQGLLPDIPCDTSFMTPDMTDFLLLAASRTNP